MNGIKMYYEIHGTGEPLVLIYGEDAIISTLWLLILLKREMKL